MGSHGKWEENTTFCVSCGGAVSISEEECPNCGRRLALRQLEKLDLPDNWQEHEGYVQRAWGVVAAYRRDDWEYFVEVVELRNYMDEAFRVKLLVGDSERGETNTIASKDCSDYDEMKDIILEFIRQCS